MTETKLLFTSDSLQIEYRSGSRPRLGLAFVFSALGNRALTGDISGGNFLFESGFDVVNINSVMNDWFQSMPEPALEALERLANCSRYTIRVALGSSMGGFAAICFSRRLNCNRVLAYSPQYDPSPQFDGRFAQVTRDLSWRHVITDTSISEHCEYCFIYDDRDFDARHIERLRVLIRPDLIREIKLRYAGHATVYFLLEIGRLKEVTLTVLTGKPISIRALRADRRRSRQYLRTLSEQIASRRPALASRLLALAAPHDHPPPLLARALGARNPIIRLLAEEIEKIRLTRKGFDEAFYRHANWDVEVAGVNAVKHFLRTGRNEKRAARFLAEKKK